MCRVHNDERLQKSAYGRCAAVVGLLLRRIGVLRGERFRRGGSSYSGGRCWRKEVDLQWKWHLVRECVCAQRKRVLKTDGLGMDVSLNV